MVMEFEKMFNTSIISIKHNKNNIYQQATQEFVVIELRMDKRKYVHIV